MRSFCNDPLWDSTLAWNNTWPQLTECFQSSVLFLLPCLFLWIIIPFHLYSLWRRKSGEGVPRKMLLILKMFNCLVLLIAEAALLIMTVSEHSQDWPVSQAVSRAVKLVSYVLVMVIDVLVYYKVAHHSPGLLMFFLLLLITHIVPFYSKIILEEYVKDTASFATFYVQYAAILCSFILHCFNHVPDSKTASPEDNASILSRLTIWWTTGLVIKGYKNPLTESDVYPLPISEKSVTVVPEFLDNLSSHIQQQKCLQQQKRSSSSVKQHRVKYKNSDKELDMSERPPLLKDGEIHELQEKPVANGSKNPNVDGKEENTEKGTLSLDSITVECKGGSKSQGKGVGFFLWKVILHTYWKHILMCAGIEMIVLVFLLSNPMIVKLLIEFTSDPEEPSWHGYLLAATLFVSSAIHHTFMEYYLFLTNKFAVRVRSVIISAVYRKSLRLSNQARQSSSSGEVIHLLSKDCDSIWNLCEEGFLLLESPFELIVGIVLVYHVVGVAMFAGLATLGVLFVLKFLTAHKHAQWDLQLRQYADERMKIASQVFSGIKVLKLYAWEEAFKTKMCAIREKELRIVFKYDLLRMFITFAWTSAIFWMIFFTFVTYVYVDDSHHLTASTVFVTMAYFSYIRRSSNNIAAVFDFIIAGINSAQRITNFLLLPELEPKSSSKSPELQSVKNNVAVSIIDGCFSWTPDADPILRNIDVEIEEGSLVAVVGMVGAGKSSLLSAILGEMVVHKGHVHKKGTIAYIPQEAWIQNDSVRNNILFGGEHREDEYREVIDACALSADLSILPSGDKTEIGEKGINLSGGQKQRVSLARAVYQHSDVYLLDDPLSAVDSHVGRHIFQHVIGKEGLLKDKTRILVTHGIHWLPEVDKILVLTNGRLTEQGSLEQLMAHNGPFAQFLSQYLSQQQLEEKEKDAEDMTAAVADNDGDGTNAVGKVASAGVGDTISHGVLKKELDNDQARKDIFERLLSIESQKSDGGDQPDSGLIRSQQHVEEKLDGKVIKQMSQKDDGNDDNDDELARLIEEEELASGRVDWSVYTSFARSVGYISMVSLASLYMSFYVFDTVAGFWLTFWVDDPRLNNASLPADSPERYAENTHYIAIYSLWGILETIAVVAFNILKSYRHVHAARSIHDNLITSVLASPIQFFDTTPVGRVLARFSKDITVVDMTLLLWMEIWIHSIFAIISVIVIIIINLPVFLAVAIPVVILFYITERVYLPTSCQLRRLESKWLSPIFSHTSESLAGSNVIRALGAEDRFIDMAEEKIDFCLSMNYASLASERWLSCRLALLSDLLVLFTGILAVTYRDDLSPGLTGLCLSMALIITDEMQLQVRVASFMERDIVSVERILQYSYLTPEAPRHLTCPGYSATWPSRGTISFSDVCVRYRPGLDMVLKNISFDIQDGEKIGVVGRTGAGKSSLMLTLFRLIEPCQGQILIDGLDICKLGLYQLRQKLTILPQDPVLFTGSLRTNFDPFEEFTDAEIWKSLEHCHLKTFVEGLTEGLDYQVGEGGDNLSIGQRQLVCLGRALLRKTKILVLDEATAAVDVETDELIQRTIRSEFESCTVLTIAHRLNTIMDYDRILVLQEGRVMEFDSPSALLSDLNSLFYQMASDVHALPRTGAS